MQLIDIDLSCKNFCNFLILRSFFSKNFFSFFSLLYNSLFLCELTFFSSTLLPSSPHQPHLQKPLSQPILCFVSTPVNHPSDRMKRVGGFKIKNSGGDEKTFGGMVEKSKTPEGWKNFGVVVEKSKTPKKYKIASEWWLWSQNSGTLERWWFWNRQRLCKSQ